MAHPTYEAVYAVVCRIPASKVATYGQIARLIDRPRAARQVGYALAALPEDRDVPWHRVVNARGAISRRTRWDGADYQRLLLEDEGVEFDTDDCIDLTRFQWQP